MAAANTDKFRKKTNLFSTNLNGSITDSATSLTCDSLTNVPTDTAVTITVDRVDTNGTSTPSKREDITGVVSGSSLTNLLRGEGSTTAQAHDDNAVVEITWETETWNDAVDGFLAEHGQDGTHDTSIITTLTGTQTLTNKTLTSPAIGTSITGSAVLDDDTFATASATTIATSESIKAYVDNQSSSFVGARVYLGTNQSVAVGDKIEFDTENYDEGSNFDPSTNYRWTAPEDGKYQVSIQLTWSSPVDAKRYGLTIRKNGSIVTQFQPYAAGTAAHYSATTDTIDMTSSQYLEFHAAHDAGGSTTILAGSQFSFVTVRKVS